MTTVNTDAMNQDFQLIHDNQYQANKDSLFYYMSHEDPTFRYLSSRSFSSNQDPKALDSLYQMLNDPILKVRAIAAYAIGQIRNPESEQALIKGFRQRDTMSVDNIANAAIIEAIGKLGSKEMAHFLIKASGYRDSDTLILESRMKSLYQFVLRGINSPEITEFVVNSVRNKKFNRETRLYAAHHLSRAKVLNIEKLKFQIAEAFVEEKDQNIKMALATALKHTSDPEIQTILMNQLDLEQDYRVKVNIIRTLAQYDYINSAQKMIDLLRDENIHVALSACEFLKNNGVKEDVVLYRRIARDSLSWQVKSKLYESIMSLLPFYYGKTKNATRWQIQQAIEQDSNIYARSAYIKALGYDPESYPLISTYLNELESPVIKTASVEALGTLITHNDFNAIFKNGSAYHRKKILDTLIEQMKSGDEGIIGAACDIIANEKSLLKNLIDSTNFLLEAKEQLMMPRHIESIHAVERALAHIRGVNKPNYSVIKDYKPVNWSLLTEFNENTKAIIKTNKGVYTIKLFLNESPGTVLNFIDLANQDYYDGKVFHRVVPNFVIQTGSPRGDNYGGEEYVIRSDLSPLYYNDEGYVGMASAGIHTESTQWFVTHSATPHLDGKYSIFGKVVEGMEVVHDIQIGDVILDVIISNI